MTHSGAVASTSGADGGTVALIFVLILGVYFFPSIVAIVRRVHVGQVIVINLFLGWTFIGWVSALVTASATKIYIDPPQVNNYFHLPPQQAPDPSSSWYNSPSGSAQYYRDGRS